MTSWDGTPVSAGPDLVTSGLGLLLASRVVSRSQGRPRTPRCSEDRAGTGQTLEVEPGPVSHWTKVACEQVSLLGDAAGTVSSWLKNLSK